MWISAIRWSRGRWWPVRIMRSILLSNQWYLALLESALQQRIAVVVSMVILLGFECSQVLGQRAARARDRIAQAQTEQAEQAMANLRSLVL